MSRAACRAEPDLPSADHVALALARATHALGADLAQTIAGRGGERGRRARVLAMIALYRVFPDLGWAGAARAAGHNANKYTAHNAAKQAPTALWWDEVGAEDVLDAVSVELARL